MAFGENFTLRKYRALKELPQGEQPGDIFQATEDVGDVLISVGCAERVADDERVGRPDKGTYKRRDQVATPRR